MQASDTVVRATRKPEELMLEEVENHMATGHMTFRPWRRHCVKRHGRSEPHHHHDRTDSIIPYLALGCGYLGDSDGAEEAFPIWVYN